MLVFFLSLGLDCYGIGFVVIVDAIAVIAVLYAWRIRFNARVTIVHVGAMTMLIRG